MNDALSDLTPNVGDLITRGLLMKKLLLTLGIIILICVISCMCQRCCCGICLQYSQITTKLATSVIMTPLADCSGHIVEGHVTL